MLLDMDMGLCRLSKVGRSAEADDDDDARTLLASSSLAAVEKVLKSFRILKSVRIGGASGMRRQEHDALPRKLVVYDPLLPC